MLVDCALKWIKKERERIQDGTWRRKRSDAGKKKSTLTLRPANKTATSLSHAPIVTTNDSIWS